LGVYARIVDQDVRDAPTKYHLRDCLLKIALLTNIHRVKMQPATISFLLREPFLNYLLPDRPVENSYSRSPSKEFLDKLTFQLPETTCDYYYSIRDIEQIFNHHVPPRSPIYTPISIHKALIQA